MIDKRVLVGGFAIGVLIGAASIVAFPRSFRPPNENPKIDAATLASHQTASLQDASFRRALQLVAAHDYSPALQIIKSQALAGRADAQYELALLYWNGSGLPLDRAQALHWTELAANQGHTAAMKFLARAYAGGEGVAADPVLERTWASRAAIAGDRDSERHFATTLLLGIGGPPDEAQGVYWLTKAAREGDKYAGTALQLLANLQLRQQLALSILKSRMASRASNAVQVPRSDPAGALLQSMMGPGSVPSTGSRSALTDGSSATFGRSVYTGREEGTASQPNDGVIDVRTGQFLAPAGSGGYVDPRDGTFYAPSGPNGVVNTKTGEYSPVSH